MSAVRTQYVLQTTATIAAGPAVSTVVDIIRPTAAAGLPYCEGTDYVTLPRQDVNNESGVVAIEPAAAFLIAGLLLTNVEVWQSYAPAQTFPSTVSSTGTVTSLVGPMFPSGAAPAGNGSPTIVRSVFASTAGLAMNSTLIPGILGNPISAPVFPGIELLANQFVKLTILNTAGAIGPGNFTAKYDLGVNAVEYRKL
jgi:hypothetical protein